MRPLPDDLASQVRSMPADFNPPLVDHGHYVRWSDTLRAAGQEPFKVEMGYSKTGAAADRAQVFRAEIWLALEYFRLGRTDLLAHIAVDRHKATARPVKPLEPGAEKFVPS